MTQWDWVYLQNFCIDFYFRNYKKKRLPFSNYEELPCKHGVLKLTNIMGNKSIPKLCKLNPIPVWQVAGKFHFFFILKISLPTPIGKNKNKLIHLIFMSVWRGRGRGWIKQYTHFCLYVAALFCNEYTRALTYSYAIRHHRCHCW